jgi:hypothetical protein
LTLSPLRGAQVLKRIEDILTSDKDKAMTRAVRARRLVVP